MCACAPLRAHADDVLTCLGGGCGVGRNEGKQSGRLRRGRRCGMAARKHVPLAVASLRERREFLPSCELDNLVLQKALFPGSASDVKVHSFSVTLFSLFLSLSLSLFFSLSLFLSHPLSHSFSLTLSLSLLRGLCVLRWLSARNCSMNIR